MGRLVKAVGALLSGLLLGCGPRGSAEAARATLSAYADALRDHDAKRLRALLVPEDRAALSEATVRAAIVDGPREADELADRLERAPPARILAVAELDDGTEIDLVLGEQGFRIADPLTRFYGQGSPRETLRSFVRAVERARWDVVLRLLPDAEAARLDEARLRAHFAARHEELTRIVALLSMHRDAPIEIVGERATMAYAEHYTARFVLEGGRWKLEAPE